MKLLLLLLKSSSIFAFTAGAAILLFWLCKHIDPNLDSEFRPTSYFSIGIYKTRFGVTYQSETSRILPSKKPPADATTLPFTDWYVIDYDGWPIRWGGFCFGSRLNSHTVTYFQTSTIIKNRFERCLLLPNWLGLPLISIFPATLLFSRVARGSKRLCSTCHYDLRAHKPGDKCPECGTPVLLPSATMSPERKCP
jgi:hypothetical protein